jgi:hypothetical protein
VQKKENSSREVMSSMCYSAAWTDSGFLLVCSHEHETIAKADACIPCAGGYVVAVENGVMRPLTSEEVSEFQRAHYAHYSDNPAAKTTPVAPAEAAASDSDYAVMTRIRVGDRWAWTTWMRFGTYAEAAAHAREGNRVVRFQSLEWVALRQETEAALPIVINMPREMVPPRGEGETFIEFVLRLLGAYGLDQQAEPISDVKDGLINTDIIDLVLGRLSESERRELERVYAEDKHALMEVFGNRLRTMLKAQSGCR